MCGACLTAWGWKSPTGQVLYVAEKRALQRFPEPSSAVAVAVALSDEFKALKGLRRVGVILSGGNVDLDRLPW